MSTPIIDPAREELKRLVDLLPESEYPRIAEFIQRLIDQHGQDENP